MSAVDAIPLLAAAGGDYQISRSVRLRSSASAYFNNASTRTVTTGAFTFSMWFKRGTLGTIQIPYNVADGSGASNKFIALSFLADDYLRWYHWSGADADAARSNGVLRDPAAWYHVVLSKPAGGVGTMYINGVAQTKQTTYANDTDIFATTKFLGRQYDGVRYFDGYIGEVHVVDGQALTPSSFGETDVLTGVWKPKKYDGTYGTNGFYLNFSDNSAATAAAIGKDSSGNGNNWTPNNISVTAGVTYDSMLDVPTMWADGENGRGNYCTLNPLKLGPSFTLSNANLSLSSSLSTNHQSFGTIGVTSGKWYWEVLVQSALETYIGVATDSASSSSWTGAEAVSWSYRNLGSKYNAGTPVAYAATYTTNDVIGVALDMDAGTLTFYKNGTSLGQAYSGITGVILPALSPFASGAALSANFGQRPFAYTPPTGFKALNTQNLPDATIKKGSAYFNTTLYTGNGGNQSITGVGFQPDLVWGKLRSTSGFHRLSDSSRGADNTLSTNATDAEVVGNGLVSFDSDGFTMDSGTNINQVYPYVAWNWKESVTAGFDIVTYTGNGALRTLSHSLGVAPKMVIVKSRSAGSTNWCVQHASIGATHVGYMNLTNAFTTNASMWNNTAPTSSVFTVNTNTDVNGNGTTYVAYLFAEVAGYSKFGSYTGNGSADGPFVYCGFKPRYVLIKSAGNASQWIVHDTARNTYNVTDSSLYPNLSNAEATPDNSFDILSNGFKIRAGGGVSVNDSGLTYIYAAFAENPFKNSLAR